MDEDLIIEAKNMPKEEVDILKSIWNIKVNIDAEKTRTIVEHVNELWSTFDRLIYPPTLEKYRNL